MSRRLKFVSAMMVQFAILGAMVIQAEITLRSGLRVELAVEPFDPIDPLSGRHLVVNLEAARLDRELIAPAVLETLAIGDLVYVGFDVSGSLARPIGVSKDMPPENYTFARATIRQLEPEVRLDYGLDRYFIPLDAEDPTLFRGATANRPELRLAVRVRADGHVVTEDLLVDGRPFAEWNARAKKR